MRTCGEGCEGQTRPEEITGATGSPGHNNEDVPCWLVHLARLVSDFTTMHQDVKGIKRAFPAMGQILSKRLLN